MSSLTKKTIQYTCIIGTCIIAIISASCSRDLRKIDTTSNEEVLLTVKTDIRVSASGTTNESTVNTLRMIIFDATTNIQLVNIVQTSPEQSEDKVYKISSKIKRGPTIKIFLVANELSSWNLDKSNLTIDSIKNITIDYSQLNEAAKNNIEITAPIIMTSESTTDIDTNVPSCEINMSLVRNVAKVSLSLGVLKTSPDFIDGEVKILDVRFISMPNPSHLVQGFSCSCTEDNHFDSNIIELTSSDFTTNNDIMSLSKPIVVYIPEHKVMNKTTYSYLEIRGTYTSSKHSKTLSYKIPLGNGVQKIYEALNPVTIEELTNEDLTITRNTHYVIDLMIKNIASIEKKQDVSINVENWNNETISGDLSDPIPYLNVSDLNLLVGVQENATSGKMEAAPITIYFWTNQKPEDVKFGDKVVLSNNTEFLVDNLFNISKTITENELLPDGTQSTAGYINIIFKDGTTIYNNPEFKSFTLSLYTKNLLRSLKFETNSYRYNSNKTHYIGAFYKNDQVGERIIAMSNVGEWSAQVIYPSGSTEFVVLSKSKSKDPYLYTDKMGDAEFYPVTDGTQSISGSGDIYFRIGLTSKLSSTADPRYAKIKVTMGSDEHYIYVRQGENPDYLMRSTDAGSVIASGTVGSPITRTDIVKIPPYNFTSMVPKSGIKQLYYRTNEKMLFTTYPTDAGDFVSWNFYYSYYFYYTYLLFINVYNPTNVDGEIKLPSVPSASTQWKANTMTPKGYIIPTNSNLKNSLYENFSSEEDTPIDEKYSNYIYGLYADGCFDRLSLEKLSVTSKDGNTHNIECTTLYKNLIRYYPGIIFFNKNNDASVFFPMPGYRYANITNQTNYSFDLVEPTRMGFYWVADNTADANKKCALSLQFINNKCSSIMDKQVNVRDVFSLRWVKP